MRLFDLPSLLLLVLPRILLLDSDEEVVIVDDDDDDDDDDGTGFFDDDVRRKIDFLVTSAEVAPNACSSSTFFWSSFASFKGETTAARISRTEARSCELTRGLVAPLLLSAYQSLTFSKAFCQRERTARPFFSDSVADNRPPPVGSGLGLSCVRSDGGAIAVVGSGGHNGNAIDR